MNKNLKIIIVVVVILCLVLLFLKTKTDRQAEDVLTNAVSEVVTEDSGTLTDALSGNLAELLKANVSLNCTFEQDMDGTNTSGETFISNSGGKVRVDITTKTDDVSKFIGMIKNGETTYIWGTDYDQGVKMTIDEESMDEALSKLPETQKDYSDFLTGSENSGVDYSCKPWIVNDSLFTPPSDVEFVDIQQQVNDAMKDLNLDCSVCDSVPAESKSQCLAVLGC
jgi:hypothetical protein